jgi:hypothetical protein
MAEARRKPKSYTTRAKTVTSVMAATALLAGWNMIANLDRAKAQEPVTDASVDSALAAAPVVQPTAVPPTPVLLPTPTAAPGQSALRAIQLGIEPLQVEPIPTLLPLGALLARSSAGVMVPAGGSPACIGVAPVPQLALRAMPSIPAPPSNNGGGGGGNNNNNSGGGSSSGGGNSNSGGGNSGGGNSSGGS